MLFLYAPQLVSILTLSRLFASLRKRKQAVFGWKRFFGS